VAKQKTRKNKSQKPNRKDLEARKYSSIVVDGVERAPSRAMLRAVGFEDADFNKPQIGIASLTNLLMKPRKVRIKLVARR